MEETSVTKLILGSLLRAYRGSAECFAFSIQCPSLDNALTLCQCTQGGHFSI